MSRLRSISKDLGYLTNVGLSVRKSLPTSNIYAMGEFNAGLLVEYGQSGGQPHSTGTAVVTIQIVIASWHAYAFHCRLSVQMPRDPEEAMAISSALAASDPAAESAADLLEAIATDVERCLLADRSLGGLVTDVRIDGWQVQPPAGVEQSAIAKAAHRVSITLRQDANDPTTYGEPRFDEGIELPDEPAFDDGVTPGGGE
ncbi:MAG: hypothetical protein AAF196_02960 [Planctomycetota bacterium]